MSDPLTLPDLTPDSVRDEVCDLVATRLAHYCVTLSPLDRDRPLDTPSAAEMRSTTLAHEAWALTVYALTGQDGETDSSTVAAAYARDRILSVTTTLDASPWDPHGGLDPVCGPTAPPESAPTTQIGLACLAAWARIRIEEGETLSLREVAALAGLPRASNVRALVSAGELRRVDGGIEAKEARRWLRARGVRGI